MPVDELEILRETVARNAAIVLSLPSAGMLRHHKSRFLALAPEGIWVESVPGETALIDELIGSAKPVGISFKVSALKTAFAVPILRRELNFVINATSKVEAILIAVPTKIKTVQRRNTYRVRIPEGCPLSVRVWRIADHAILRDRPLASTEVKLTVRDLSVGGIGARLDAQNEEGVRLIADQRLRVEVKYGDHGLILDASLRHAPDANRRVGIQFKKMENDLVGRQAIAALTRIVGELQREEVRRTRLGLAEAS